MMPSRRTSEACEHEWLSGSGCPGTGRSPEATGTRSSGKALALHLGDEVQVGLCQQVLEDLVFFPGREPVDLGCAVRHDLFPALPESLLDGRGLLLAELFLVLHQGVDEFFSRRAFHG